MLPLNVALKFVFSANVPAAALVSSGSTKFSRRSKSLPLWSTDRSAGTPAPVHDAATGTQAAVPLEPVPEDAPLAPPLVDPVPAAVPLVAPVPAAPLVAPVPAAPLVAPVPLPAVV